MQQQQQQQSGGALLARASSCFSGEVGRATGPVGCLHPAWCGIGSMTLER